MFNEFFLENVRNHTFEYFRNVWYLIHEYAPWYLIFLFFFIYWYLFGPSKKLLWPTFLYFYFMPLVCFYLLVYAPFMHWILSFYDLYSCFLLNLIFTPYFFCICIAYLEVCEGYEKEIKEDCPSEYLEEVNFLIYPEDYFDIIYCVSFLLPFFWLLSKFNSWVFQYMLPPKYIYMSPEQFSWVVDEDFELVLDFPDYLAVRETHHLELQLLIYFNIIIIFFSLRFFYSLGTKLIGDSPLISNEVRKYLYFNYFIYFIPVLIYIGIFWTLLWYHNELYLVRQHIFYPFFGVDYHFDIDGWKHSECFSEKIEQ